MFEGVALHYEPPAVSQHIFNLVESSTQPHLHRTLLLGIAERTTVVAGPDTHDFIGQEEAYRKCGFAIRSDVEDVFARRTIRIRRNRPSFADEIVLIHVALFAGVSLHASESHVDMSSY